jgi:hypothetical protein
MSERIGHGALGLVSGLRDFDAFAGQSASTKQAYLEIQGGMLAAPWALDSGDTYSTALQEQWDGYVLDVVGVVTADETLARVETAALCRSTPGSFYYPSSALSLTTPRWDDGTTTWDSTAVWDPGGFLYVHLVNGADPNNVRVVALFAFYFGTRGSVEAITGPEKLANQGLEQWSGGMPVSYTAAGSPGVTISQETGIQRERLSALKLSFTAGGLIAGDRSGVEQASLTGVMDAHYLASGFYRTSWGADTTQPLVHFGVRCDASTYMASDGYTDGVTVPPTLRATNGEWRRFVFYFRSPVEAVNMVLFYGLGNAGPSVITSASDHALYLDDLHLYRIYRYVYFEPRLSAEGIPELQRAANDLWFASESTGLGAVKILNRDDERDGDEPYLETMFGRYDFCSRGAFLRYGGALANGQEIPYENSEPGWAGVISAFEVDASSATIQVESVRGILSLELPLETYNKLSFPGISEQDNGRPRPIVFGTVANVKPVRILLNTGNGLGIYEIQDRTYGLGGTVFNLPAAVYAYEDEDAAGVHDPARRKVLQGTSTAGAYADYEDVAYGPLGRIFMLQNPGPVRIVAGENDAIDWDAGGGALECFVPAGLYTWAGLLTQMKQTMEAVSGIVTTLTYNFSTTTHTISITHAAATLNLRLDTGANARRSIFSTIGFSQTTDLTGLLTYTSATSVPYDPDAQIIRADIYGYRDDASGTYTGTAGGLVQLAPDIAHYILRVVLKQPASLIDISSFVAGRTRSTQQLGVYIGGLASIQGGEASTLTAQEIFDRLEVSGYGDINVDNRGVWAWLPRIDDEPRYSSSVATVLENADFLDFSSARSLADVYQVVRVNYAQDPSTGMVRSREVVNTIVPALFQRMNSRTWDSYLLSEGDAATLVFKLARPAGIAVNRYRFTVKGKLVRLQIGSVVDVSARLRKLEEHVGQAEPYLIRLTELSVNPLTHVAEAAGFTHYFGMDLI